MNFTSDADRKQHFAFHEAGHAVAALLNGYQLKSVDIYEDDFQGGVTSINGNAKRWTIRYGTWCPALAGTLRFYAAGHAASKWQGGENGNTFVESSEDRRMAIDLTRQCGIPFMEYESWNILVNAVTEQLNPYWNEVTAVAHALLNREYLRGHEVEEVTGIKPVTIEQKQWEESSIEAAIWLPEKESPWTASPDNFSPRSMLEMLKRLIGLSR